MSRYRLAKEINVPAQRIGDIVNGKRAISADTDLRLCKFFGLSDGYWLRVQVAHDIEVAAAQLTEQLSKITPWAESARTRTVVKLFTMGSSLVTRSEAKRLLVGLEKFREVELDFEGVEFVGQGFVDEVFRVWSRSHPDTSSTPMHMNHDVAFMVNRGRTPSSGMR
ncbi:MAG TPA: addiction module antidote protein, HigA family [Actinobacteria bacterium]|nr:addiction module antidote protein, HigA family [Actinomycetota bacterium]